MLRAVPFIVLFLLARALAGLCAILPWSLDRPIRWCELRLLYFVRRYGPGGFDDAVQLTLVRHAAVYATPVTRLLRHSPANSLSERIALAFVEDVRGSAEVDSALSALGNRHPDARTRSLINSILAQAPDANHAP
jgi:hypothetical protein